MGNFGPRLLRHMAIPLVLLAQGCGTEPQPSPEAPNPDTVPSAPDTVPSAPAEPFQWGSATPESQGMCGSTLQLGCTTTLEQIWATISDPKHNTKRFLVIRNDKIIYDQGGTAPYSAYSASKGLLGSSDAGLCDEPLRGPARGSGRQLVGA